MAGSSETLENLENQTVWTKQESSSSSNKLTGDAMHLLDTLLVLSYSCISNTRFLKCMLQYTNHKKVIMTETFACSQPMSELFIHILLDFFMGTFSF